MAKHLTPEELDHFVLGRGLAQIEVKNAELTRSIKEEHYGQAYVTIGDLIDLLHGLRRIVKNLEAC